MTERDAVRRYREACHLAKVPDFAPWDAVCRACRVDLAADGRLHVGITGCPHCHTSWCD
jgi:hypothetical protein